MNEPLSSEQEAVRRISRNDALAVSLLLAQVSALTSQVSELKEWMEKAEQPVPGELPAIKA